MPCPWKVSLAELLFEFGIGPDGTALEVFCNEDRVDPQEGTRAERSTHESAA